MTIRLDHMTVFARDRRAAAETLAYVLGVPWGDAAVGPFSAVYLDDGLTLDIDEATGPLPIQHLCFRVDDEAFDAIVARLSARGIPYRSLPHGPVDLTINHHGGGRLVYWSEPDGHVWEALTVSYARRR